MSRLGATPGLGPRTSHGGLAGAPFTSNVLEGARLAASLAPDVVIFDGSGAAIPPILTSARVLVAHDLSGLNAYRALISDVVSLFVIYNIFKLALGYVSMLDQAMKP